MYPRLLDEITTVLTQRPRIWKWISVADAIVFVENIVTMLDLVPDPAEAVHHLRDETDDYLVALARENRVEYMITGDRDLLDWSLQFLPVISLGKEVEFEESFGAAKLVISSMPEFRSWRLSRWIEQPNKYLLLLEWDTLEDHTERFRGSPSYQQWQALLRHFYNPFSTVLHFENCVSVFTEKT